MRAALKATSGSSNDSAPYMFMLEPSLERNGEGMKKRQEMTFGKASRYWRNTKKYDAPTMPERHVNTRSVRSIWLAM